MDRQKIIDTFKRVYGIEKIRKFGFFDILGDEEASPKKNFERAISYWEDSYCGC